EPFRPFALVVEDDQIQRELLALLLDDSDFDVIERDTGESAATVLHEHGRRISMLFADVNLAGHMSGVELAFLAKQYNPLIDIVITSGRPVLETLPPGAKFWQKPWARLDLIREAAMVHSRPASS